jgi:3-methyladenine DNA glycosylase AlkD
MKRSTASRTDSPASVAKFVASLVADLRAHADATRASAMRAYMRDQFAFFGVSTPHRRAILRAHTAPTTWPELLDAADALFACDERECQYCAVDLLMKQAARRAARELTASERANIIERTERLITTRSWWDTVDGLAPKVAGTLLRGYADELTSWAHRWIEDDNIWLQRFAILLQLNYKRDTDSHLLFDLILRRCSSTEFFIRKGAGWALRSYSYVDPTRVRAFIDEHEKELSGLTKREGGKYC